MKFPFLEPKAALCPTVGYSVWESCFFLHFPSSHLDVTFGLTLKLFAWFPVTSVYHAYYTHQFRRMTIRTKNDVTFMFSVTLTFDLLIPESQV